MGALNECGNAQATQGVGVSGKGQWTVRMRLKYPDLFHGLTHELCTFAHSEIWFNAAVRGSDNTEGLCFKWLCWGTVRGRQRRDGSRAGRIGCSAAVPLAPWGLVGWALLSCPSTRSQGIKPFSNRWIQSGFGVQSYRRYSEAYWYCINTWPSNMR